MEIEKGTPVLWYDTIGQIPIRIGIPIVLTALEVKAALEEFVGVVAELAAVPDAVLQKIVAEIPLHRLGEPADVARAVLFLAADEAAFITGATLAVNGGQYMA